MLLMSQVAAVDQHLQPQHVPEKSLSSDLIFFTNKPWISESRWIHLQGFHDLLGFKILFYENRRNVEKVD